MPTPLPLVTVITPTYNRADLLEETIESILAQDYPNIEYIVLDDGSTDGTADILRRYDGRIRWAHHENMGQARTVNRGFEMATGELICTINSDDPQPPGLFGPLVQTLVDDPETVLVYPDWNMIDCESRFMRTVRTVDCTFAELVKWYVCIPGPGTLFRRTLVDAVGGWDPGFRFCPDFDWFLRAGLVGRFRRVPGVLAQWRFHPGSITSAQRGEAMASELVSLAVKFFSRDDLPPEVTGIRAEAFRNAYITAGVLVSSEPAADTRFILDDRVDREFHDSAVQLPESTLPEATIQWLHQEVATRDAEIRWLHEEVALRDKKVGCLHGEVATRDAEIRWLHEEVALRDEEARRLHGEVAAREAEIRRMWTSEPVSLARRLRQLAGRAWRRAARAVAAPIRRPL